MEEVGRLAFRECGNRWVAYYALSSTMEGAIELLSIDKELARKGSPYRDRFIALASDIVADILEEATGERPEMGHFRKAPGHERRQ